MKEDTVLGVLVNQQERKLGRKLTHQELVTLTEALVGPFLLTLR